MLVRKLQHDKKPGRMCETATTANSRGNVIFAVHRMQTKVRQVQVETVVRGNGLTTGSALGARIVA